MNIMVEDKYIGLVLAVSSSLAIGTSFIITKKVTFIQTYHNPCILPQLLQGLNDAAERNAYGAQASDNLSYLKSPIWWAGMSTRAYASSSSILPDAMSPDLPSFC